MNDLMIPFQVRGHQFLACLSRPTPGRLCARLDIPTRSIGLVTVSVEVNELAIRAQLARAARSEIARNVAGFLAGANVSEDDVAGAMHAIIDAVEDAATAQATAEAIQGIMDRAAGVLVQYGPQDLAAAGGAMFPSFVGATAIEAAMPGAVSRAAYDALTLSRQRDGSYGLPPP